MLPQPSNQNQYSDYFSADPAFVAAPVRPSESAPAEERTAYEKAVCAREAAIKCARETGDWSQLRGAGEPTRFVKQPLRKTQVDWIADQLQRTDDKRIGANQMASLVLRCALVKIVNSGVDALENFKPENHHALGKIAPASVIDTLGAIDQDIVLELAAEAWQRANDLNPL